MMRNCQILLIMISKMKKKKWRFLFPERQECLNDDQSLVYLSKSNRMEILRFPFSRLNTVCISNSKKKRKRLHHRSSAFNQEEIYYN